MKWVMIYIYLTILLYDTTKCLLVPKTVLFWPYEKAELVVEELKSPVALEVAGEDPNKPVVVPAPTWFCGPLRLAW